MNPPDNIIPSLSQHIFDLIYSIFEEGAIDIFKSAAEASQEQLGEELDYVQLASIFLANRLGEKFIFTPKTGLESNKSISFYTRSVRNNYLDFKVFISYRRKDTLNISERIVDHLSIDLGRNFIFKDTDSIPIGENFNEIIKNSISKSSVCVIVIGDKWISKSDKAASKGIFFEHDAVRKEIELAIELKKPIIPILVNNATMPSKESLPRNIQGLTDYNAIVIRNDPHFKSDINLLISNIRSYDKSLSHLSIPNIPFEAKLPVKTLLDSTIFLRSLIYEALSKKENLMTIILNQQEQVKMIDQIIEMWLHHFGLKENENEAEQSAKRQ
ncbi:MAG: toll/interleukin-1 receptor domain-containing protein [Bacteroidota bacterium]